ncbi:MAG: hypothetical protein ABJD11_11170 [Gemmatimonadota bacterium]
MVRSAMSGLALMAVAAPGCARSSVESPVSVLAVADTARVFAAGVVSTGREFAVTFDPDGRTVLFTRSDSATRRAHIFTSRFSAGQWLPATPVGFSSDQWSDLDPSVSPDGKLLYFVSTRSHTAGATTSTKDMDIWFSEATGEGWGEPHWIPELGSNGKEGSPTIDRQGTICFFSDRDGPAGKNAIFCAARTHHGFSAPLRLSANINAGPSDTSPFLAPDGRTLLFYSTRAGGAGQADLYASFKAGNDWGPAISLGAQVNTADFEYNPVVSRDGAVMIFGRKRQLLYISLPALGVPGLSPARFR